MIPDVCPKCMCSWTQVQHTRHHIVPKRIGTGDPQVISLCRSCHDRLERRIPTDRVMPRSFYFLVVNNFLGYTAVKDENEECLAYR